MSEWNFLYINVSFTCVVSSELSHIILHSTNKRGTTVAPFVIMTNPKDLDVSLQYKNRLC